MISKNILNVMRLDRETIRYFHSIWTNLEEGHTLFSMYSQFEFLCTRDELFQALNDMTDDEYDDMLLMTSASCGDTYY